MSKEKASHTSKPRIVLVGGGSRAWSPKIMADFLLTEATREAEFVLYDIDPEGARLVADFTTRLARDLNVRATAIATDDAVEAFTGADYILVTISTGGLDAMEFDLSIPEDYGIYHTVGDTCGPGGWARYMRNFAVFADLADQFSRLCPHAMVINYTNPMPTLTATLSRLCPNPVVGLCHGLFENLEFFKKYYGIENIRELSLDYAGLNHFFWITRAHHGKRDLLADLRAQVRSRSLTDLMRDIEADAMGFKSNREVATEWLRHTGCMPYLGDRHTCEYSGAYITDPETMSQYELVRTDIGKRRAMLSERDEKLRAMVADGIPQEYHARSHETAADIVAAHLLGEPFIDVGNMPNIGQIANLPSGTVVETAVRVDAGGFTPLCHGPLPQQILGLVEPFARFYDQCVNACLGQNRELALNALRLDPVCSHLSWTRVQELGERLLQAHQAYLPDWLAESGGQRLANPTRRTKSIAASGQPVVIV